MRSFQIKEDKTTLGVRTTVDNYGRTTYFVTLPDTSEVNLCQTLPKTGAITINTPCNILHGAISFASKEGHLVGLQNEGEITLTIWDKQHYKQLGALCLGWTCD